MAKTEKPAAKHPSTPVGNPPGGGSWRWNGLAWVENIAPQPAAAAVTAAEPAPE